MVVVYRNMPSLASNAPVAGGIRVYSKHSLHILSFIAKISIASLQIHYYAEALHSLVSERLSHGPYVVARVRFEPVSFLTQGTERTTEPQHPSLISEKLSVSDHVSSICGLLLERFENFMTLRIVNPCPARGSQSHHNNEAHVK